MAQLPSDAKERKALPICSGVVDYFPDALVAVAEVSRVGNDQHNPGQPLHWDKSKSTDHADCIMRHLLERGTADTDTLRHSAKLAWRALALLQTEIENERDGAPKLRLYPAKAALAGATPIPGTQYERYVKAVETARANAERKYLRPGTDAGETASRPPAPEDKLPLTSDQENELDRLRAAEPQLFTDPDEPGRTLPADIMGFEA